MTPKGMIMDGVCDKKLLNKRVIGDKYFRARPTRRISYEAIDYEDFASIIVDL